MAEQNGKCCFSSSNFDVLLHPELLSHEFMKLLLTEKKVNTGGCGSRERLTELYVRHVMPLPQRTLPDSRWGRSMEKKRAGRRTDSSAVDHSRKRPLIVFDGSSSSSRSAPPKVKKPEGSAFSAGISDRLKPPPAANLSNPIRKLTGATPPPTSSLSPHQSIKDGVNLKRDADASEELKSPEAKKKIQHVTWP
ncbi:unnamed protein product [Ophioblennius macclurei]